MNIPNSNNIAKIVIRFTIHNENTKYFLEEMISLPKRPILVQGDLGWGKTQLIKFLGEIFLMTGRKLIGMSDSTDMELFEFTEHYPVLWILPSEFEGCYLEVHPNLKIEYIDLENRSSLYKIIQTAREEVILVPQFLPLMVHDLTSNKFKLFFSDFPESVFIFIELSRAFKARRAMGRKSVEAGDLFRQIRHIGGKGSNLIADTQVLEDSDIVFRRVGGSIKVFKRMTLYRANFHHNKLMMNFPGIEKTIQTLTPKDFITIINGKVLKCINPLPSFSTKQIYLPKYFKPNVSFETLEFREIQYENHLNDLLSHKKREEKESREPQTLAEWQSMKGGENNS